MQVLKIEIKLNKKLVNNYYHLVLDTPQVAKQSKPGQFVMVRVTEDFETLLPRPFSIYSTKAGIEIIYKVVGKGTELLSHRKKGEKLSIFGPLGNGFFIPPDINNAVLIAGGYGVAPLFFLASYLVGSNFLEPKQIVAFIGAKTKNDILCEKDFKKLGVTTYLCTEDGSCGKKGIVTEILQKRGQSLKKVQSPFLYACGPTPMLKEVSRIADKYNLPCQISLEAIMGCGSGVCLSCVCQTKGKTKEPIQKLVCHDGPVFNSKDIIWG